MNTTGDGDEDLELLMQGLPLSAPVAADMGQSRTSHYHVPRSPAPVARWGAHAAADDLPAGHPYGGSGPYASVPPPAAPPVSTPPAPPAPAEPEPEPAHEAAHAAREGHAAAVGRTGHERTPETPAHLDYLFAGSPGGDPPDDPNRVILRKQLDALRVRAASAASWQEASQHYARLVNSDGVVPVTARFTRDDIEFLGRAREEVLGLAELGLRLLDLHAPLDAGGISTDPSSPIMRCRSCMWRWPCPTFSLLNETVGQLPHPGSPLSR
jgi:hypothetical protein